jgi:hypothetical protein
MREFNEADRKKKKGRIQLPENPDNLSAEAQAKLETAVKGAVKDGYVPCPSGWGVAREQGVSRLAVGATIDRLGIRVSDCQLGCFAVSKTDHLGSVPEPTDADLVRRVEDLHETGELTCANVFALAAERQTRPRSVADAANARGYKLRRCQLGCF